MSYYGRWQKRGGMRIDKKRVPIKYPMIYTMVFRTLTLSAGTRYPLMSLIMHLNTSIKSLIPFCSHPPKFIYMSACQLYLYLQSIVQPLKGISRSQYKRMHINQNKHNQSTRSNCSPTCQCSIKIFPKQEGFTSAAE